MKNLKDRQYQKWSSDEVEFILDNLDKPLLFLSEKLARRKDLVNKKVKQLTGKYKTDMEKEEEYSKIVFALIPFLDIGIHAQALFIH